MVESDSTSWAVVMEDVAVVCTTLSCPSRSRSCASLMASVRESHNRGRELRRRITSQKAKKLQTALFLSAQTLLQTGDGSLEAGLRLPARKKTSVASVERERWMEEREPEGER
jgi:hypothetical protein